MIYKLPDDSNTEFRPIRYFTPTLNYTHDSNVTLNADKLSVTAKVVTKNQSILPLHLVTDLSKPGYYQEFLPFNSSSLVIRWLQRYFTVPPPQNDAAPWLLDNITVTYWDGKCQHMLLNEDFESLTPLK